MPNKKTRTDQPKHAKGWPLPVWTLWLAIGLGLVVAAVIIGFILRAQQQAAVAFPAEVSAGEAWAFSQQGAIFVDVRPHTQWNAYHIKGSRSIPLTDLASRLHELPKQSPIVVVDDSFTLSPKGRDLLRKAGFVRVTALLGGMSDWVLEGYPIEGTFPY